MTQTVPDWLRGVWRRERIELAGGEVDTSTQVFWLQGLSAYGDLRLAAERPGVHGFDAKPDALRALAQQQGATGHCHCPANQAIWRREWGYQPVVDYPEPGDLTCHGKVVIERAPSGAYVEEWHRLTRRAPRIHVWRHAEQGARLLIIDDFAMLVRQRTRTLPARPLADLLEDTLRDPAPAMPSSDLLDCEISYATRRADDPTYRIALSTLPWKEGDMLTLCDAHGEVDAAGWLLEEHHPGGTEPDAAGHLVDRVGTSFANHY